MGNVDTDVPYLAVIGTFPLKPSFAGLATKRLGSSHAIAQLL